MAVYSITNLDDLKKLQALAEKKDALSKQRVLDRIEKQTFDEQTIEMFKPVIESTQEVIKAIQNIEPSTITNIYNPVPAIEPENQLSIESDEIQGLPSVDKELSDAFAAIEKQGRQPGFDIVPVGPNEYLINQTHIILRDGGIYGRDFQIPYSTNMLRALIDRTINPSNFPYEDQENLYTLLNKVGYQVPKGSASKRLKWFKKFSNALREGADSSSDEQSGSGLQVPVFLPSDPNELVERLSVLIQERQAGNDNVLDEGTAILDFLREVEGLTDEEYINVYDKLK